MLRYLFCAIGLSFGATCSTAVPPDRPEVPEIGPVAYQCDDGRVFDAWFGHEYARLQFFDQTLKLDQKRAADGGRYADGDNRLWINGDQATLTLEGRAPVQCREDQSIEQARREHVSYRALGQEPGWLLDIRRGDRFVLHYDNAQKTAEFPYVEPTHPGEGVAQFTTTADGNTLEVRIRYTACHDAMSGQAYPDTVELEFDDRILKGCGRPL